MNRLDALFVVRTLGVGGSERQLIVLARGLARRGRKVGIAVFYRGGKLEESLGSDGVELIDLQKSGRWQLISFLGRFRSLLILRRPRVVHGYLPVPNLLVLFAKRWLPSARVVWGVRDSGMEAASYDRLTRLTFAATRAVSRFADLVIANSEAGRRRHLSLGYPTDRLQVISNGIDTDRFHLPTRSRDEVRPALGLPVGIPIVGCVARYDQVKGVDVLIASFALARQNGWRGHLAILGDGNPEIGREWRDLVTHHGLDDVVTWRSNEPELNEWYGAIDALCLPSRSEGFSNVLAEAMACGTRCLATDVGDATQILGNTGVLFSVDDRAALVEAISGVTHNGSAAGANERRQRIVDHYSVGELVMRTDALLFPAEGP